MEGDHLDTGGMREFQHTLALPVPKDGAFVSSSRSHMDAMTIAIAVVSSIIIALVISLRIRDCIDVILVSFQLLDELAVTATVDEYTFPRAYCEFCLIGIDIERTEICIRALILVALRLMRVL